MQRINRKLFINEYNKISTKLHIPTSKVAKRAKISQSYAYKIVSPTTPISVSIRSAKRIGKGLGMNAKKYNKWIKDMLNHQNSSKKSIKYNLSSENRQNIRKSINHNQYQKPSIVMCPQKDNRSSQLSRRVKQLMDEEDINTRQLSARSDLNRKCLHEIFNGTRKTVPALTASRIAYGLKVSPHLILSANHYEPPVKSVIFSSQEPKKAASINHPRYLNGTFNPKINRLIKNANRLNSADIEIVNLIVHRLLDAENKIN